jgi:hypothetical protein
VHESVAIIVLYGSVFITSFKVVICGRKYPYTPTQYYDQKEKIYRPSTDVLLADRIRRGKKIDTSFHLTGKPYCEHQDDYEDETPWW